MNKDKYVFASLVGFLDNNKFRHLVDKYQGNRYIKSFSCWNQLLSMMFGQLCNREGLRDLVVALRFIKASFTTSVWGKALREATFLKPTKIGITASLRTSLST